MQVVCCCDDECVVARLTTHNHVLSTLCGVHEYPYVVTAAVHIQRVARGHRLRVDKDVVDRAMDLLTRTAHTRLCRRRFLAFRNACVCVQAHARGACVRRTPLVSLMRRVREDQQEIMRLHLLVLRLTALGRQAWMVRD